MASMLWIAPGERARRATDTPKGQGERARASHLLSVCNDTHTIHDARVRSLEPLRGGIASAQQPGALEVGALCGCGRCAVQMQRDQY